MDHRFVLDENDVQAVFLQDSLMKTRFEKFPELILTDSTHKTNENDMPFFAC